MSRRAKTTTRQMQNIHPCYFCVLQERKNTTVIKRFCATVQTIIFRKGGGKSFKMLFAKRKKAQIKRRLQDIENYPTRFDQSRTPDRNRLWIYKRIWMGFTFAWIFYWQLTKYLNWQVTTEKWWKNDAKF